MIAAREARSHGAVAAAEALHAEAERLRQQHAAAIAAARAEAQQEVQELLRQAEAEQRRVIGEAADAAQRSVAEVRERRIASAWRIISSISRWILSVACSAAISTGL